MNEVRQRLTTCFATVFPHLSEDQILHASPRTIPEWDSVSAISLVNVVEEEFETQIDFEYLAELDSFDALAKYLADRPTAAGPSESGGREG